MELRVVEGVNAIQTAGSAASTALTVLATDDTGKPLSGVTISFRLPDEGATGVFANGLRTEILLTREDGRAAIHGIEWGPTPGVVQVRITGAKGADRAGTVATLQLMRPIADSSTGAEEVPIYKPPSAWTSKWTIIALTAAGVVGGGLAFGYLRRDSSPSPVGGTPGSGTSPTGVQIGPPIITITAP
jgi:hypothetical protein